MPSPLGHALGGIAVGWLAGGRPGPRPPAGTPEDRPSAMRGVPRLSELARQDWVWLAAIGMAPDLDLLFGTHSTYTHSLGAVLIVALVTVAVARARRWPAAARTTAIVTATYASHLLLDWLSTDTTPPFGIMALWPFSDGYHKAPVSWFLPIARDIFSRDFWLGNPKSIAWEVLVLAPVLAGIAWLRRRPHASTHPRP